MDDECRLLCISHLQCVIHGIGRASHVGSHKSKLYWTILILCFFSGCRDEFLFIQSTKCLGSFIVFGRYFFEHIPGSVFFPWCTKQKTAPSVVFTKQETLLVWSARWWKLLHFLWRFGVFPFKIFEKIHLERHFSICHLGKTQPKVFVLALYERVKCSWSVSWAGDFLQLQIFTLGLFGWFSRSIFLIPSFWGWSVICSVPSKSRLYNKLALCHDPRREDLWPKFHQTILFVQTHFLICSHSSDLFVNKKYDNKKSSARLFLKMLSNIHRKGFSSMV